MSVYPVISIPISTTGEKFLLFEVGIYIVKASAEKNSNKEGITSKSKPGAYRMFTEKFGTYTALN